jgi:hypothetical protein
MSEFFNADGEPMMDGVSMMREGYYHDEYDVDTYYDNAGGWEPDPLDPSDCDHGDGSYPEGAGFDCDKCESLILGPRTRPGVSHEWDESGDFFVNW